MALRPPRHRIDAKPRFISAYDDAWGPRLDREIAELEEERKAYVQALEEASEGQDPPKEPEAHPQVRYALGMTRFDLDAPIRFRGEDVRVSEYLEGKPTVFHLGQLPPDERYRAAIMIQNGDTEEAFLLCCRWGLVGIDDGPEYRRQRDGRVSDACMSSLMDAGGPALVHEIGAAVWLYNQSLSEPEKKA